MAELKKKPTTLSPRTFINQVESEQRRKDCRELAALMQDITGQPPKMWGSSIVGFGTQRCTYANGREAEWMLTAFSPRKQNITLYLGHLDKQQELLKKLGTHSCGKGCVYIKRLSDVHMPTLTKLVKSSVAYARKSQPS